MPRLESAPSELGGGQGAPPQAPSQGHRRRTRGSRSGGAARRTRPPPRRRGGRRGGGCATLPAAAPSTVAEGGEARAQRSLPRVGRQIELPPPARPPAAPSLSRPVEEQRWGGLQADEAEAGWPPGRWRSRGKALAASRRSGGGQSSSGVASIWGGRSSGGGAFLSGGVWILLRGRFCLALLETTNFAWGTNPLCARQTKECIP